MIPITDVWGNHPQRTSRTSLQVEPISSEHVSPLTRVCKQLIIKVVITKLVGVMLTPPAICPVLYRIA
eukprot:8741533-Heterocapsa_arctica.AAC.1